MPVARVPDLSRCLKNTTHINLEFGPSPVDGDLSADSVVRWLARRSGFDADSPSIHAHLEELRRRRRGGHSIPAVAKRSGTPLTLARSSRLLSLFNYAKFEVGGLTVSVDILNAGNELGLAQAVPTESVEVFVLSCPPEDIAPSVASLLLELVSDLPVTFAFGGSTAFAARFAFGLQLKQSGPEAGRTPREFLWPLMFTRALPNPDALARAGLFRSEKHHGGYLMQMWRTLANGQHEAYRQAAHGLNLGCLWDLQSPGIEDAGSRAD